MTGRASSSSQSLGFKNSAVASRRREDMKEETAGTSGELFNLGQPPIGSFNANDTQCQICGDKATGRHYGAISCDGCKGFFRRSIRKKQAYQCRHQKMCSVDKDKRNQCRYCRLQKCIRIGMKQEAVQSERDRISSRSTAQPAAPLQPKVDQGTMLSVILNAELVFQHAPPSSPMAMHTELQEAGVDELLTSMKEQVLLLVQWAKRIPPFMQLAVDDQICLLKAHASEHLLLGVTRRSRNQGFLLLGNNYIVSRQSPENSFALIAGRVLDQLLIAFRNINVDDTEYACLKAIIFFDPYADGLQARESVFNLRQEIILALYSYIRSNCGGSPTFEGAQSLPNQGGMREPAGSNSQSRASSPRLNSGNDMMQEFALVKRFGELLLLVPSVRSIAEDMVDHIKFYKLFGAAKVDNVLHELLLGDTAADDTIQPVPGVASGPNSQPASYPSSGAATPVLCNAPNLGPTSDLYGTSIIQSTFPVNSITSSPADTSFDSSVAPPSVSGSSTFTNSFGVLDSCMAPPMNLLTPQHHVLNGSPLNQSPGLSTLAAAAFVASQSMGNPIGSNFSSSALFLSPPAEQYSVQERMESPTILSFAFSNRPSGSSSSSRRSTAQGSPLRSGSLSHQAQVITMKPEQIE